MSTPELPFYGVRRFEDTPDWDKVTAISLTRADGVGTPRQNTKVRACHDGRMLRVRFDVQDTSIWGNFTRRDEPLWEEEVVEVFIASGTAAPKRYFEFEVSPDGVIWDGSIHNPNLTADPLEVDARWNCDGLQVHSERIDSMNKWIVWLAIPFRVIGEGPDFRANFYRIDRPFQNKEDGRGEFSAWSPTLTPRPNFHRPDRFGTLKLL
jgi:Carbohydrate-binding family 9